MRAVVVGKPAPWGALAIGAALALLYLALACALFGAVGPAAST